MKSIIKLWIVATVAGLFLSLFQPAYAFELQRLDFSDSIRLLSKAPTLHLTEAELATTKAIFMTTVSVLPANEMHNGFSVSKQLDVDPFYWAVVTNPMNSGAWNNLGYQLFRSNHYEEALLAYDHALRIEPDYSLGLANRCGVLSKLGKYDQALLSCKFAIEKDQHWGEQGAALAWDNQGDALFNLQRYQEALKSFEQAIALNPSYLNARRNWAIVQHQLSQISEHPSSEHLKENHDV